jgi:hypothetical protein
VLPIPYVGAVAQNVLRLWAEGFSPGLVVQRAVADRNSPGLVVQEVREKTLCTVLGRKNQGKWVASFIIPVLDRKISGKMGGEFCEIKVFFTGNVVFVSCRFSRHSQRMDVGGIYVGLGSIG